MGYATGLLEFSDDPLSDATPTYVDVTAHLRMTNGVTWADGKSRDLDEPQAGQITFELKNPNGEWTPNSPDSLFPDSPFLLRRFRWSVNGTAEGVWYATDWRVDYPAGTSYSTIVVTAVDLFELLALDTLPLLDPPTASTYEEMVLHDQPFAYYKLDEQFGTQAAAVAGPEGTYKNTPTLGSPGLVVGDPATSMLADANEGVEASLRDTNHFSDRNSFTVEGWVTPQEGITDGFGIGTVLGGTSIIVSLGATVALNYRVGAVDNAIIANSTTVPTNGVTAHVVGTFDAGQLSLYINGVLEDTAFGPSLLATGANPFARLGNYSSGTGDRILLQHVAFYEHALTPERVLAHYEAGTNGFAPELAGERVANIADSTLWAETEIETGDHMVGGVFAHGQSKLDEIRAAVKAEMPDSHFFADGDGNPVYRGWNYNDGNGVLGTFGPGGIGYQGIEPVYDSEMFNEVTVGHESAPGEETQHTVTDATSEGQFFRRAHAETGLILSMHHDAIGVATAILERFKNPQRRFASMTINGNQSSARTQILARQIGDLIRVKGVGVGDADIVTTILGRSKTLSAAGHLTCTWSLGRGFDAAAGLWQLGIDGFSELGETTVLA